MVLKGYGPLGDNSVSVPLIKYRYIIDCFSILRTFALTTLKCSYRPLCKMACKSPIQTSKKTEKMN